VLLPWFFGWHDPGLGFDVALHAGTLLAVLWYFGHDWLTILGGVARSLRGGRMAGNGEARLFWLVCLGSLPAALTGLAIHDAAETILRAPLLVAATLSVFGVLLWLSDRRGVARRLADLGWADAILIGIAQAFAFLPGVSRSGVTITMARFLEADREAAARFSFLLATPITLGAMLLRAPAFAEMAVEPGQLVALAASTFFGFAAIAFLIGYVRRRSYAPFVVYRIVLAAVIAAITIGRGAI
jgi:undecaprenyl-diphosphatase